MSTDDPRAFRPTSVAGDSAAPRRRRWWPWMLAAGLVLGLGAAALLAQALLGWAHHGGSGLQVRIDGGGAWGDWGQWGQWGHWSDWHDWGDWGDGPVWINGQGLPAFLQAHWGLLLLGLTLALAAVFAVVTVVVPLAVLLGLLAAVLGVGVALLAVAGAAAAVLSPLWLPALLLWLLLRRRRPASA